MALRELIRTHLLGDADLRATLADRVFPGRAPQRELVDGVAVNLRLPYVTYTRISGSTVNSASDLASNTRTCRVQFDIIAADSDSLETLGEMVKARMNGWRDTGSSPRVDSFLLDNELDDADEPIDGSDTGTYRLIQDYICWYAT